MNSSKAVLSRHGTISLYPRLHRLCRRRINADHPSRKQRLAAFAESIGPLLRHPHTIRYTKNNVAGSSGPAIGTISKRRDDSQRFPRHQAALSSPSANHTHDCIYDCINKKPIWIIRIQIGFALALWPTKERDRFQVPTAYSLQ